MKTTAAEIKGVRVKFHEYGVTRKTRNIHATFETTEDGETLILSDEWHGFELPFAEIEALAERARNENA